MKLSIIVPVYNAAQYLPRFLKCFEGLQDAELILVDDGATDGSGAILEELVRDVTLTPRCYAVKVLHQENRGVSAARQAGLDLAQGDYVIFADPDDTIDAGMYDGLLTVAEKSGADLVWEDFFENGRRRNQLFSGDGEDMICAILMARIHGATWNKLIRKSYIDRFGVRFREGRLGLCEDVDFLCRVLIHNPKLAYVSGCHYRYTYVKDSATHGMKEGAFVDLKIVTDGLSHVLITKKTNRMVERWRKRHCFAAFLSPFVSDLFLQQYEPGCRSIFGAGVSRVWCIFYWLGIRCRLVRRICLLLIGLRR